ncbi:MAG: cystathionine beta-synthase [Leptospiraceae bacterium]|nr:cystathionine beta-synthase [Leptospiraceae bacterium]
MGSIIELIGNTPIVKLSKIDTGISELYLKLENQNPGGSIKDRIGLSMITDAEKKGYINKDSTLIEATAGNTGLGIALVASLKGYKLILVIPDKMSQEKVIHLRAMGAKIIMTRSDVGKGHPEYYQDLAEKIHKETPNSFYINQFNNPANPLAHETTTGPEIFQQMNGDIDALVCGVGSSGTITGLSRYFSKMKPDMEMILADPKGSILADYINHKTIGEAGSWVVEGIGEDFIPPIADFSFTKKAYTITDEESLSTARELLSKEGILGGSSSGTLVAAALKYCRESKTKKRVVTFICDSGNKYLSKVYNDYWMIDQGFLKRDSFGDLRDLISRRHIKGETVFLKPDDTLLTAFSRMKLYDISQLPVLEDGENIVGILDEYDILLHTSKDKLNFQKQVKEFMTYSLTMLSPATPERELLQVFDSGKVAIVVDKGRFLGLITKIDYINFLRRKNA